MIEAVDSTSGASAARAPLNVVVVTYNSGAHIREMLESLPQAAPGVELRIVVVDNESNDDTIEQATAVEGVDVLSSGAISGTPAASTSADGISEMEISRYSIRT